VEVLADPEFYALKLWLTKLDITKLQSELDDLVARMRRQVDAESKSPIAVKAIFKRLSEATEANAPIEPILSELRACVLAAAPNEEHDVDSLIAELRQKYRGSGQLNA
jgi:elongation factor P--beta-lysine ligase